ncbi:hypothetical protein ES703_30026 [subsurface metagenome]
MVLIITESWWPAGKSAEVGKIYLEVRKKYPVDKSIEKRESAAIWAVKEGMHSIGIYSIKPGKVKEAMDIASNRALMIASSIEGLKYNIIIAYDLVEAMPLIGLKAPED